MVCENRKRSGLGLLCSNFLRLRKPFPVSFSLVRIMLPPHPEEPFQVHTILAARNNEIEDLEMEGPLNKHFRIARGGDRLMGILFECDLCQFRNIKDGDPIHGSSNVNYTLICIRQLILGAFRSQDTSTVSGNFRRLRRDYFDSAEALSIRITVPIIGTDKLRDRVGMGCAIQTMDALQINWKWQNQLQWYLMRRTPTWYNNAWEEGSGSLESGAVYS